MVDDISPLRVQKKTRSASICATTGSIENVIQNSSLADANGSTPNYRRRRPATRTQSARITATSNRSVRRRTPNQQQALQHNLQETRSYCNSEPRLSETETPPQRRKLSQRRPQQHATPRKSNAFLDVPTTNMHHLRVSDDDDEIDRLRTFSSSKGGVINRGDSFRRRRSRSNSLAPTSPLHPRGGLVSNSSSNLLDNHQTPVEVYRVIMIGSAGVGKQALISQFRTSDCINAYDGPECDKAEQNVSIILNGIESELQFATSREKDNKDEWEQADAYIVVYSCIDKESFTRAKQIMSRLQDMDYTRTRPVILVANKIDLARSRSVSSQDGKCLACTFGAKFIEVSVGINHNCDELLAGTLTQIRLKKDQNRLQNNTDNMLRTNCKKSKECRNKCNGQNADYFVETNSSDNLMGHSEGSSSAHWYKSRSVVLASMKARQMLTWILGKEDSKFKHCENLQVL